MVFTCTHSRRSMMSAMLTMTTYSKAAWPRMGVKRAGGLYYLLFLLPLVQPVQKAQQQNQPQEHSDYQNKLVLRGCARYRFVCYRFRLLGKQGRRCRVAIDFICRLHQPAVGLRKARLHEVEADRGCSI